MLNQRQTRDVPGPPIDLNLPVKVGARRDSDPFGVGLMSLGRVGLMAGALGICELLAGRRSYIGNLFDLIFVVVDHSRNLIRVEVPRVGCECYVAIWVTLKGCHRIEDQIERDAQEDDTAERERIDDGCQLIGLLVGH